MQQTTVAPQRVVRIIEPTVSVRESVKTHYRVLRVAAYCRVSTKQEEQLNSYENQVEHYTERINSENGWTLEGIYADKGISGTSVKNRDEFNRMIRRCKQGKIDMIITKSIARFARNTVDCLKYFTRTLFPCKMIRVSTRDHADSFTSCPCSGKIKVAFSVTTIHQRKRGF